MSQSSPAPQENSGLNKWRPRENTQVPLTDRLSVEVDEGRYGHFYSATGGRYAGQFEPPTGYFNEPDNEAQGGCTYNIPGEVAMDDRLANRLEAATWEDEENPVYMHVFHEHHWGLWTFTIDFSSELCAI
jgi:hypothetical protein